MKGASVVAAKLRGGAILAGGNAGAINEYSSGSSEWVRIAIKLGVFGWLTDLRCCRGSSSSTVLVVSPS